MVEERVRDSGNEDEVLGFTEVEDDGGRERERKGVLKEKKKREG